VVGRSAEAAAARAARPHFSVSWRMLTFTRIFLARVAGLSIGSETHVRGLQPAEEQLRRALG